MSREWDEQEDMLGRPHPQASYLQVAGAAKCGAATADFSGEMMGARVSAFKFA